MDSGKLYSIIRREIQKNLVSNIISFIPELAILKPSRNLLDNYGINMFYTARRTVYDDLGNLQYIENDFDLSQYWSDTYIQIPGNTGWLSIYSRYPIRYGFFIIRARLPNITQYDDGASVMFGFKNGEDPGYGSSLFVLSKTGGTIKFYTSIGGSGTSSTASDLTSFLPSDYTSSQHTYWIKINTNQIWFGIDNRLRTIVLLLNSSAPIGQSINNGSPPYSIYLCPFRVPVVQHVLLEYTGLKTNGRLVGGTFTTGWKTIRWNEEEPITPLVMPLFKDNTDNMLISSSISDTEVYTQPVPVYGYTYKSLLLSPTVDGTLTIETYSINGVWKTYDSFDVAADQLVTYNIDSQLLLIRVKFETTSTPYMFKAAEVIMR